MNLGNLWSAYINNDTIIELAGILKIWHNIPSFVNYVNSSVQIFVQVENSEVRASISQTSAPLSQMCWTRLLKQRHAYLPNTMKRACR